MSDWFRCVKCISSILYVDTDRGGGGGAKEDVMNVEFRWMSAHALANFDCMS